MRIEQPDLSSPEAFADWFISGAPKERYAFFDSINWREGYGYCKERGFAEKTGYYVVKKVLSERRRKRR